jgi:hypothetical protein
METPKQAKQVQQAPTTQQALKAQQARQTAPNLQK